MWVAEDGDLGGFHFVMAKHAIFSVGFGNGDACDLAFLSPWCYMPVRISQYEAEVAILVIPLCVGGECGAQCRFAYITILGV